MYRHGQEEIDAVARVMRSGRWFRYHEGEAGETNAFERELAASMRSPHALAVSSGTAALMCCYAGLGLGPGDEVIIPGYTWIASALAPLHLGIVPVIVDIDESLTLDPEAVERAITPRTKAIDPVHMNGLASDLDALGAIARRHGIPIVEDACQADGGRWTGDARLGAVGECGAYSFNHFKVISSGDGGAFVARDRTTFERGMIFHDGGCIFRPHAKDLAERPFCGINLRANEILSAILRVQLGRLDGIVDDLQRARARVLAALAGTGLQPIPLRGGDATGTGAYAGFAFVDAEAAQRFCAALGDLGAYRPIDSGRHVYRNWDPVIEERGAWSHAADPFRHPANARATPRYHRDMLPRTLAILARTALVPMSPEWDDARADAVAERIARAAESTVPAR